MREIINNTVILRWRSECGINNINAKVPKGKYERRKPMKKLLLCLLILVLTLGTVVACVSEDEENPTPDTGYETPDYGSATVYAPGDSVLLITSNYDEGASSVKEALEDIVGKNRVSVGSIYNENRSLEVLFNVTQADESRPAIAAAQRQLERFERPSYFTPRYVIYADSGTVCITFDEVKYTNLSLSGMVAEIFVNEFLKNKDYFVSGKGVIASGTIELIPIQEELDIVNEATAWENFRKGAIEKYGKDVGTEIYEAFRTYYSMFSEDLYIWAANLYEPAIGGFYACASGRDGEGFLPLVETSGQIMGQLVGMGLFKETNKNWGDAIPELMKYQMIYFFKSCQDPNGFFYPPQMAKADLDKHVAGRQRNTNRAASALASLGSAPTYTTSAGVAGDGITADEFWDGLIAEGLIDEDTPRPYVPTSYDDYLEHLTGGLGGDTASAISKIILTDSTSESMEYVANHENFAAYLDKLSIDSSPYVVGNELNATYSMIAEQARIVGKCEESGYWYSGMDFKEMLITWLTEHINGKGLFGKYDENSTDPSAGCKFINTNGFFKIMSIYNGYGYAYPEPALAARGCLIGIMSDEESKTNVCETYNIWEGFGLLIHNVNTYVDDEALKTSILEEIDAAMREYGADAVINSYNKQKRYQKEDGGFSHDISKGTTEMQGGVQIGTGVNEANVDGNGFATYAIVNAMLDCMGLTKYEVQIYRHADYMKFIECILELQPVIKYSYEEGIQGESVFTFDEMPTMNFQNSIQDNVKNSHGIVTDKGRTDDPENKVLQYTKTSTDSGMAAVTNVFNNSARANCVVYSVDLRYSDVTRNSATELTFGNRSYSGAANALVYILFELEGTANGSKILFSDGYNGASRNQRYDTGVKVGEWFNLRVEVYSDGTMEGFVYKMFINDQLFYTSAAIHGKNYFNGTRGVWKTNAIDRVSYYLCYGFNGKLSIDNLSFTQNFITKSDITLGRPGFPEDAPDIPQIPTGPAPLPDNIPTIPAAPSGGASDALSFDVIEDTKNPEVILSDYANGYGIITDEKDNKIFFINKTSAADSSNSGVSLKIKPTKVEENATVMIFETDIFTRNYQFNDYIQITINSSKATPFVVLFKPTSKINGAPFKLNDNEVSVKTGNWFRFRMEYKQVGSGIEAKLYLNNELVQTITSCADGKTPLSVAEITNINMAANAKNIGEFAYDNISLRKLVKSDYVSGKLEIPEIEYNEVDPSTVTVVTFDRMPAAENMTIGINDKYKELNKVSIVEEGTNKVLFIDKNANGDPANGDYNGGVTLYQNLLVNEAGANYAVFDADIKMKDLRGIAEIQITMGTGSNSAPKSKSPIIVLLRPESSLNGAAINNTTSGMDKSATGAEVGKWFHLRLVYYVEGGTPVCKMYVNGTEFNMVTNSDNTIAISDVRCLTYSFNNSFLGDFFVDNSSLKLVKEIPALPDTLPDVDDEKPDTPDPDEPKPDPKEEIAQSFDEMPANVSFYNCVGKIDADPKNGENKALVVPGDGQTKDVKFSVSADKDNYDVAVAEVKILGSDVNALVLEFFLISSADDKTVYVTKNYLSIGQSNFYSYPNGEETLLGKTPATVGEWFTIRIEYRVVNKDGKTMPEVTYKFNGETLAVEYGLGGTGYYSGGEIVSSNVPSPSDVSMFRVRVSSSVKSGNVYFDDLVLMHNYDAESEEPDTPVEPPHEHNFVDGKCECGETDPNYNPSTFNGVVDFSEDYSEYISFSVAPDFDAANPRQVVEVEGNKMLFIDKNGKDTAPNSYNGGISLVIKPTLVESGATVAVIEFDYKLENITGYATQITLNHKNGTGKSNSPLLLTLPRVDNEWVHLTVTYKVTASEGGKPTAVEYSIKAGDAEAEISTEIYGANLKSGSTAIPAAADLTQFVLGLNNAFLGDAYFDNVSFKLLKNYETPHKHNFVDGKCECGESDPDYVAPEVQEEKPLTFDEMPANMSFGNCTGSIADVAGEEGNKAVVVSATENDISKDISFVIEAGKQDYDVAVAEFKMLWVDVNRITTEINMFTQGGDNKSGRLIFTNFSYSKLYPYANTVDRDPFEAPVSNGNWFTFRIEYRVIEKDGKILPEVTYKVDGNTIMVENDVYGSMYYTDGVVDGSKLPAPKDIVGLRIRISSSVKSGSIYLDDVVFMHNYDAEEPDTPVEPPHEHNFVEGKCECGETDPNYVAPEEPAKGPELTFDEMPANVSFSVENSGSIGNDPLNEGNKALVVVGDGVTKAINFTNSADKNDYDVAIAEYKMLWNGVNNIIAEFMLVSSVDNKSGWVSHNYFSNGRLYVYPNNIEALLGAGDASIGAWFTVRIEYRVVEIEGVKTPQVTYKINDVLIGVDNGLAGTGFYADGVLDESKIPSPSEITKLRVQVSSSVKSGSVYVDDVLFTYAYDEAEN